MAVKVAHDQVEYFAGVEHDPQVVYHAEIMLLVNLGDDLISRTMKRKTTQDTSKENLASYLNTPS